MQYTSKNYKFSINTRGLYIGCSKLALIFDPAAWKELPRLYRNPVTFVGFGFYVRIGELRW